MVAESAGLVDFQLRLWWTCHGDDNEQASRRRRKPPPRKDPEAGEPINYGSHLLSTST